MKVIEDFLVFENVIWGLLLFADRLHVQIADRRVIISQLYRFSIFNDEPVLEKRTVKHCRLVFAALTAHVEIALSFKLVEKWLEL